MGKKKANRFQKKINRLSNYWNKMAIHSLSTNVRFLFAKDNIACYLDSISNATSSLVRSAIADVSPTEGHYML